MPGTATGPIYRWSAVCLALGAGGCAVVGSVSTFQYPEMPPTCQSRLGSYSLPKAVLNFRITKEPSKTAYFLEAIKDDRVPDNQHTFCLDHLRSPTASDEVRVFKNKIVVTEAQSSGEVKIADASAADKAKLRRTVTGINQEATPFLQLVASKAIDHTAGIIRRFIRTAFILLTNKASFAPARSSLGVMDLVATTRTIVADFTVDPFDHLEMGRVNESVRKFGFCFVLEDYTFDRSRASVDRYCGGPYRTSLDSPPPVAEVLQKQQYLVPKPVSGVFYRPRAAYRLSVYLKDDPNGRGSWRLGLVKNFHMENIMPIVSVGVSRAIFAARRTGLVFDDGTLTNVCISKGSEIEGAIEIPLDVIYGIIALPSEMVRAAVTDATTAKQLLEAQKKLVDAQNKYIKFLNDKDAPTLDAGGDKQKAARLQLGTLTEAEKGPAIADVNPDAGAIVGGENDALSEICAELVLTKTRNPGLKPDDTEGNF